MSALPQQPKNGTDIDHVREDIRNGTAADYNGKCDGEIDKTSSSSDSVPSKRITTFHSATQRSSLAISASAITCGTSSSDSFPILAWNGYITPPVNDASSLTKSLNTFSSSRHVQNCSSSSASDSYQVFRMSSTHELRKPAELKGTSDCPMLNKADGAQSLQVEQFQADNQDKNVDSRRPRNQLHVWQNISALYGILVAMTSIGLMVSSHLTHNLATTYSRWFDCLMLAFGVCFMGIILFLQFRKSDTQSDQDTIKHGKLRLTISDHSTTDGLPHSFCCAQKLVLPRCRPLSSTYKPRNDQPDNAVEEEDVSYYLKFGAVIFAAGSLIYSSLEMGVYMENRPCFSVVAVIEPCLFVLYIMMQLYFVFQSTQIRSMKYQIIYWFGTIHLIATDLCIWIRILIDETLHEFSVINARNANRTDTLTVGYGSEDIHIQSSGRLPTTSVSSPLCADEPSIMQELLEKASVFLYPCIVEYTLIAAGIVFTIWSTLGSQTMPPSNRKLRRDLFRQTQCYIDCNQSAKGLFAGIATLVPTTVGIILFFVFNNRDSGKEGYDDAMAVLTKDVMEITLNLMSLLTTMYCMVQFAHHFRITERVSAEQDLTAALLLLCMVGVNAFGVISILGAYDAQTNGEIRSLISAMVQLISCTFQTSFLIDAGKRSLKADSFQKEKYLRPGREALVFLLFLNFALWATNIFCTLHVDASPIQRDIFGVTGWAIILHVTIPLVIFYRFHSTTCLVEIWKRAYENPKHVHNTHTDVK